MTDKQRWLRDADWVRTSPFLMPCELEFELAPASTSTDPFAGHRVGYYFEHLVKAILQHTSGIEMLASGQQVIEDGRTIGELDFIFRDNNGQVHHWEVAAKFYLYCAENKIHDSHFIGPNAGDTFERKRSKITDQQLPLSRSAFPDVTHRSAFVKGRIFYHPLQDAPANLPKGLQPNHLRSTWLRQSELALLHPMTADAFCILQKPHWLAPESLPDRHPSLMAFAELEKHLGEHFSEKDHPLLLAAMKKHDDTWSETERIFVVSDQWPQ